MKRITLAIALLLLVAGAAPAPTLAGSQKLAPLKTVEHVDLERYAGTWYEISSFPIRFQKGCTATTAVYSIRPDGQLEVVNSCHRDSLDGRRTVVRGHARVVDRESNAKLKVSFFWPVRSDYWIIDLGSDYEYAVIGHPTRRFVWVLSRTRTMDPAVYAGITARLSAQGYDVSRLKVTLQP